MSRFVRPPNKACSIPIWAHRGDVWLFARKELDRTWTLFVDEGGQFALADAIAVSTAARASSRPDQLRRSRGSPTGAEASVLSRCSGRRDVRPEWVFLEQTWRMRPE
jgi:uncharacterized protein